MRDDPWSVQQRVQSAILSRDLIGNYEIIRKIGEGSFSSVFLASHIMTRHEVVLKRVNKTQSNLAAEIANMSLLSHPHISRLYEYIIMPDNVWLVLEYCGGEELLNFLVKFKGGIPIPLCTRLFSQLAGAVAYAHQLNCAHRDLKLENVLLDAEGNVKLGDFGFTRSYLPRSFLETVCGTESYMAPEILLRKKYLPEASDVWSLGVILYALIYGKLPFDDDNTTTSVKNIVEEDPVYYEVPPEGEFLVNIVKKLLNKNPHHRPRAMEMLELLGEHGNQQLRIIEKIVNCPKKESMFSSKNERTILKGMKALSIDLHTMASSVVHHKCDPLHGLWFTALDRHKLLTSQQHHLSQQFQPAQNLLLSRISPSVSRARSKASISSLRSHHKSTELPSKNGEKRSEPFNESPVLNNSSRASFSSVNSSIFQPSNFNAAVNSTRPKKAFRKIISALKINKSTPKETLMAYYEPTFDRHTQNDSLNINDSSALNTSTPQLNRNGRNLSIPPKKSTTQMVNRRQSMISVSSSLSFSLADLPSSSKNVSELPLMGESPNAKSSTSLGNSSSPQLSQQSFPQQNQSQVVAQSPPLSAQSQTQQAPQSQQSQQSQVVSSHGSSISRPMSTYSQISQISQLSQSSVEASKLLAEANASLPGSPQGPNTGFDPPDYSPGWRANSMTKRYSSPMPTTALTPIASRQRTRLISVKEKIPNKIEEGESEYENELRLTDGEN